MNRTIFIVLFCNLIEWYDFMLYGHLSYILSELFFPVNNQYAAIILSLSTFALGFIARPLGAIIFGYIGDRIGRKASIILSIKIMLGSTIAFVFMPTYSTIGILSPILLVLTRIIQGISFGGQSGGVVLMSDSASVAKKTIFVCGLHPVSSILGVLFGYLTVKLLVLILSELQLSLWGWRIPFLIGVIFTCCVLYLRMHVKENLQNYTNEEKYPIVILFKKYKKNFIISCGLYSLSAASFYTFTVFIHVMLSMLQTENSFSTFLYCILMLVTASMSLLSSYIASISDRNIVIIVISVLFIILIYPIFNLINNHYFFAYIMFAMLVGSYLGPVISASIDLFPVKIRQTGTTLSYNIAGALAGGTAPLISMILVKTTGLFSSPAFYIIGCSILALISVCFSYKLKTVPDFN